MDENMNKDYGIGGNEENNEPKVESNSEYSEPKAQDNSGYSSYNERPVTPPTGYSQNYNPQYTYNNQANQYMPYGSYNYANNNQQPQKKKSKGKKKGGIIAAVIIVLVVVFSLGVIVQTL